MSLNVPTLIEIKTKKAPLYEIGRAYDTPLQVAAYAAAADPPIRQALIAVALPDRPAELFALDHEALDYYFDLFAERLEQYKSANARTLPLPTVSQILKGTETDESRARLADWRRRVGETNADRIVRESAERGRALHSMISRYLESGVCPVPSSLVAGYWRSVLPLLETVGGPILSERELVNKRLGYRGRFDSLVYLGGMEEVSSLVA